MKRQSNFINGLAGLVIGASALFGGAKTANGGLVAIQNNFPVDSPNVLCYHL